MAFRMSRRSLAIAMIVLAGVALALVAAALWNPWRLTMLYPIGHAEGAVSVLVLAGAMLAVGALMVFASTGRRAVFGVVAAVVAVPALCVGLPAVVLGDAFRTAHAAAVLAISPGGGFAVVKYTVDTEDGPRTRLYIRSRELLLSREARVPLAECPYDPFDRDVPAGAVRFTSETTVAIPIRDESTTVVRFDPDTLEPDRTVPMCQAPA